jgi:hypothetical protein
LLTARVFANRFWALCFHEGLSRSLDDFGGQGEPPSHPELLDRLAHEFVESGWNVRALLKLLIMSRAYRQSSVVAAEALARDPENRWFGRQHRFRLPAEMVRDTALAASGLLVQQVGGASVKPYQPAGYYKHLNFPTRDYTADDDRRQWRRGVYVHWQRQFLHPMLKAFDAPSREECTARRPTSNTPLASLVLLNDPTFVEAARVLATHSLRGGGPEDEARIVYLFRSVLSRPPDEVEQRTLLALLADGRRDYQSDSAAAQALVSSGIAPPATEYDPRELAAWTTVARAVLNAGEAYLRN